MQVVSDTNSSSGYAIKSPAATGNIFMDVPYSELLPGAYEMVFRVRTAAAVSGEFVAVYSNGAVLQENFGGVNTATTYKTFVARFSVVQNVANSTMSFRLGDATQDLYLDYMTLRPASNDLAFQQYVPRDFTVIGSSTTPGYRVIFSSTSPVNFSPTENWNVGDMAYNDNPSNTSVMGWRNTVAGNPGTWTPFGVVGQIYTNDLVRLGPNVSMYVQQSTNSTTVSSIGTNSAAIAVQNSKKMSININGYAKVFHVWGDSGDACFFSTSWASTTISSLGSCGTIVLSTAPASNQIGVSKALGDTVDITAGSSAAATNANIHVQVYSSITSLTDWR